MSNAANRFSIKIQATEWQLPASAAGTVLDAAMQAGVRLPSSCRNGTCRTCMCRLISGRVGYQIEWPGLSADEKADGYILPCVAYPQSDLVLEASVTMVLASLDSPITDAQP